MTQEKKHWLLQTAKVIREITNKHMYSQLMVNTGIENEYFEDSCNYVSLCSELREFSMTLENMVKYAEMSKDIE